MCFNLNHEITPRGSIMSFSISGIFKPAKQTEPVSYVAPKTEQTDTAPKTETPQKKDGNGGSCCGGCGGGGH
jgi:hypothetical protein